MHPYTVKNWLWVVIVSMFILIALLTGCSSAPKHTARQYCQTSQEIVVQNGNTVGSQTVVKCNDDPVEQIVIKKAGIAQNCGEYVFYTNQNGKAVPNRAIACQKFDGRWEVVNN